MTVLVDHQERRKMILERAFELFAEEGFSVKKTAERLHITEKLSAQLARKLKLKK